jgi:imidazole glycerol-phosphate synthase subunit HisH
MIAIVDYGMGNLRSVQKGFEKTGHAAQVTSDPEVLEGAEKIVLPGVGAFGDAMRELATRELIAPLRAAIAAEKPFLGICLGLQLLFDTGHEGGRHEGLGVLRGEVVRFNLPHGFKVPHMGWNGLRFAGECALFSGLASGTHVYFVHSFHCVPTDQSVVAAWADYGGEFVAAIARGRLFATQFHPEKSQTDGLRMLDNFARL